MSATYNADEIIEIAENIEKNGARFYQQAARVCTDTNVRELLQELAEMEDRHESYFSSLKTDWLHESENFLNPEDEAHMYLQAIASGCVFNLNRKPQDVITGEMTEEDLLKVALGFEKDAIIFFMGMKEAVPDKQGKERISALIKEEMNHVTLISNKLAELVNS